MYTVSKRTCRAIVLFIRSVVLPRPRCCRRRGLLKVPIYIANLWITKTGLLPLVKESAFKL